MKNTIRRALLIIIMLLVFSLVFTACDEGKDNGRNPPDKTEDSLQDTSSESEPSPNQTTVGDGTSSERSETTPDATTGKEPEVTTGRDPEVTTGRDPEVTTGRDPEVTTGKDPEVTTGNQPHTHAYGEWKTVVAATCTEDGEEERVCACGDKETRTVKASGHDEVIDKAVAPTCTKTGVTEGKHCSVCGKVIKKQTLVDKLSHKAGEWTVEKQATKTTDGLKVRKCTLCKETVESEIIHATGSQGLAYAVNDDKVTCTVTGIGTCTDLDICVPAYIDGYKVTAIGGTSFAHKKITSISFPNTVTIIEREAFAFCPELKSISLPSSIVKIAFYAFNECQKLDNVVIPGSVELIGVCAFSDCDNLKTLTFENGVKKISDLAFSGCKALTSVVIPDSVTVLAPNAFDGCASLKSVTIGKGIEAIGERAFKGCTALTSVIIPDNVKIIGNNAFCECSNLSTVTLPEGLQNIGNEAFLDCTNLQLIAYKGTKTQWELVSKGENWNANTGNCVITYSGEHVHTVDEWIIDREATPSQKGSKHGKCKDCGKTVTEEILYSTGSQGLYYQVNSDGKTCTILGIGSCKDTELVIGEYINGYKVTKIGDTAFISCKSITSLVISDSVTVIGNSSFRGCSSLKSVVLGNGIKTVTEGAFDDCTRLVSVTFGSNAENINESAFSNCTSLKSITLPKSIKKISAWIFSGNKNLSEIIYQGTEAEWNSISKDKYWAEGLTLYTIVCSDKSIPSGCSQGFTYEVNSDGNTCTVTGIGTCTDQELYIGGSIDGYTITAIGEKAFINCNNITSVTIGGSITTIENYAFCSVYNLEKVTVKNGVIHIGDYAFRYCSLLTSVILPDSVTTIGEAAFDNCKALTSINIPPNVKSIGRVTFRFCESLTSIILPEKITDIGQAAFANCRGLESINIPDSVASIGISAFGNCMNLTNLTYKGTKEQWNAVSKGNYWDRNTGIVAIHCADGTIEK